MNDLTVRLDVMEMPPAGVAQPVACQFARYAPISITGRIWWLEIIGNVGIAIRWRRPFAVRVAVLVRIEVGGSGGKCVCSGGQGERCGNETNVRRHSVLSFKRGLMLLPKPVEGDRFHMNRS
jgi:hypothetical protein